MALGTRIAGRGVVLKEHSREPRGELAQELSGTGAGNGPPGVSSSDRGPNQTSRLGRRFPIPHSCSVAVGPDRQPKQRDQQ